MLLRFYWRLLLAIATMVCGFCLSPALSQTPEPPDEIVISGRVVDEDGRPLEGVEARLGPDEGSNWAAIRLLYRIQGGELPDLVEFPAAVLTGPDGRFQIHLAGRQTRRFAYRGCDNSLELSHEEYLPMSTQLVELTAAGTCDRGAETPEDRVIPSQVSLPPAVLPKVESVGVRVVDPQGEAAAGAWVRILGVESDARWRATHHPMQTDDGGRVDVVKAADRPGVLSAYQRGLAPAEMEMAADTSRATIQLGAAQPQTLRVLYPDGRPAQSQTLTVLPGRWPLGSTGSRGRVEILRTSAELGIRIGRHEARLAQLAEPGGMFLLDLGAPRPPFDPGNGPSVHGRVVTEEGDGISGAVVSILSPWGQMSDGEGSLTLTADDGSYQLTLPVPPASKNYSRNETPSLRVLADGFLGEDVRHVESNVDHAGQWVAPPLDIVLQRDLRIRGTIRSAEGETVPGALVLLASPWKPGQMDARTNTAADGSFLLEGVEHDLAGVRLQVMAGDQGGLDVPLSELPEPPEPLDLVLEPAASFLGRVVDDEGEGVDSAMVAILQDEVGEINIFRRFQQSAATEADGSFRLLGLRPGTHELAITCRGFHRLVREITVSEGPASEGTVARVETFELEPLPTFPVSGRFVGTASLPEGLRIQLYQRSTNGGTRSDTDHAAEASSTGEFRIAAVPPGRYEVGASAVEGSGDTGGGRRQVTTRPMVVMVDGPTEIEVELSQTASIVGRILGLAVDQLEAVTVYPVAEIDSTDGTYRIDGLQPGWHSLTAFLQNDEPGWALTRVQIEPGQTEVYAELEFDRSGAVRGVVMRGDEPVSGAAIQLRPGAHSKSRARTNRDGTFALESIPRGIYDLFVFGERTTGHGNSLLARRSLDVDGASEVRIDLDEELRLRLSGRVVDGETDDPLADVQLTLVREDGWHYRQDRFTERDGTFRIDDLEPGLWRLMFKKPGFADASTFVEIESDAVDMDDIEMAASEGLELRLRGPRGHWPATAEVSLLDDEGHIASRGELAARSDGWMRLGTAPKGRWRILVQGDGLVALSDALVPGPPLELAGQDAATLRVEVQSREPMERRGRLEILDGLGRPIVRFHAFDGMRDLVGLPPGRVTVRVTAGDREWTSPVDLPAGSFEVLRLSEEP